MDTFIDLSVGRNMNYLKAQQVLDRITCSLYAICSQSNDKLNGQIHNPEKGDQAAGILPGTPSDNLPLDGVHPLCGNDKKTLKGLNKNA